MNTAVMFSRASDDWQTPIDFFRRYDDEFHFTIDGAANERNHQCPRWYGPGGIEPDAVTADWCGERVWLNPPYSQAAAFLAKVVQQCNEHSTPSVVLLPARTDTKWFHEYIWNADARRYNPWVERVDWIKGRLKFIQDNSPVNNSAPFPSMVVVVRDSRWLGC